jgi:hypothetical protein
MCLIVCLYGHWDGKFESPALRLRKTCEKRGINRRLASGDHGASTDQRIQLVAMVAVCGVIGLYLPVFRVIQKGRSPGRFQPFWINIL